MQTLSAAETLTAAMDRRPALRPLLEAFLPLVELRALAPSMLMEAVEHSGFALPAWSDEAGAAAEPLLASASLEGLGIPAQTALRLFLPVFGTIGGLTPHTDALSALAENVPQLEAASRAYLSGDGEALEARAAESGLPSAVLAFALEAVLGAVLRAAALRQYPAGETPAPWDERPASWGHGWCPVCGSAPSVAWLEEKGFDPKNAFAAGGGGKKHLHCGLCGTEWRFRRGACPSCGSEEASAMEILREAEGSRGERVEWCTKCGTYCPSVDLRERDTRPHMDALALSLMHLDMVAAEKGLAPLYPAFWNQHRAH